MKKQCRECDEYFSLWDWQQFHPEANTIVCCEVCPVCDRSKRYNCFYCGQTTLLGDPQLNKMDNTTWYKTMMQGGRIPAGKNSCESCILKRTQAVESLLKL